MRVFLSFHTPDRALALGLKSAIEATLPDADVFVDQTHLRYGHLWQPALFDAIAKAQAFVILVSNRLGDWQTVEYYEAFDRKAKDRAFILLPVIIADRTKGPAANLPGLSQLHWIESTEPTAPEPLSKIVAALQSRELPKPPEPWRAINPYRGLLALEEQDADFFFGRDGETGEIIKRVMARPGRLIALIGKSGVGKSSLVQAGVIGSLKRQRWPGGKQPWPAALKDSRAWAYLAMKPGEDPVAALASEFATLWFAAATDPQRVTRRNEWAKLLREGHAGLADLIETTDKRFRDELALAPAPRVLLYIDQGEELYARAGGGAQALLRDHRRRPENTPAAPRRYDQPARRLFWRVTGKRGIVQPHRGYQCSAARPGLSIGVESGPLIGVQKGPPLDMRSGASRERARRHGAP